jgi:hypothetical protein
MVNVFRLCGSPAIVHRLLCEIYIFAQFGPNPNSNWIVKTWGAPGSAWGGEALPYSEVDEKLKVCFF